MKRFAFLLAVLMLLAALPVQAASEMWFPDPGPAFGGTSEYVAEKTYDGVTYDICRCVVEATLDTVSSALVGFTESLRDMGYAIQGYDHDTAISYQSFTAGGYTAEVMLSVLDGFEEILDGGAGTFEVFFVVPQALGFTLGSGLVSVSAGSITCIDCKGSGRCAYCVSGRTNYGAGYEDCVVCDGYARCTVCDGAGYY